MDDTLVQLVARSCKNFGLLVAHTFDEFRDGDRAEKENFSRKKRNKEVFPERSCKFSNLTQAKRAFCIARLTVEEDAGIFKVFFEGNVVAPRGQDQKSNNGHQVIQLD